MKYIILIALLGYCLALRQQSVAITGKLLCGTTPASGVTVKLWEEDDGQNTMETSFKLLLVIAELKISIQYAG
ncbi:hypothetical protein COOONC_13119 [Cooperia oncophora]